MKVTFLGTNGWYASNTGNTVSVLIESKDNYIILDAGDGIYKIDSYIDGTKPILLFLSHVHLDHIIGFHSFAKLQFKQKIDVYGYIGTEESVKKIFAHPYSTPITSLSTKIQFHDIDEGDHDSQIPFSCKLLDHPDPTIGYKFKIDDKIITYCTDTGICDNLYVLAENADLLIMECAYKPGQEEWGWLHLKPEESADIAKKSNVRQLVLTHFDASYYKTLKDREVAEEKARKIFPNTLAATDDLELNLI